MTKAFGVILLLLFYYPLLGQVPLNKDPGLLDTRMEILERIGKESERFNVDLKEKIRLSRQYRFPLSLRLNEGKTASFQFMDEAGQPVYYTTFNVNAAQTTGAASMQSGGVFNLNLTGGGMVVGIYDQTRPKANHSEFGNRVSQIDGSTEIISNHATHVTGTILASGINANARGMANEATGWAFNWEGDISKMIQNGYDPDLRPRGHLISNHSYGILVGWYRDSGGNWAWSGNESIDNREDYRFGFYTAISQQIDELAFSKPYYTVVWAAGNDRNEVGDGTKKSDGPEDSIGPEGVAKNNLTIGAVNGVNEYIGPSDVVMSPFSSWGPVDDGRIKPDLVAMGVNVFSTAIANEGQSDSYATFSGTSMAAPNATGSLFLLQELYHMRNASRYMRSATLKGLAIHTAKEAGLSLGPDYMYGWGLLDVETGAEMIINENGSSNIIRELVLENNQVYEFDFISDGISPAKVTISWTDPAGNAPAPAVDPEDLMLVNDLDLRIIDEEGVVYFPWTLDPSLGSAARAENDADNFRDNIEQILLPNPLSKRYTVRVTHKGTLQNELQAFSLIFNAGVTDGQDKTLYWIGGEGDWNSPSNWALTSNGPGAGMIPDNGTRVVFDQSPNPTTKVILSSDAEAFSLNFFGNSPVEIDLNTHEVTISNGFRVSNQITSIQNGLLTFRSAPNNESLIDFGTIALDNVELAIREGDWRIVSAGVLDQLIISNSRVNMDLPIVQVSDLDLQAGGIITGNIEEIIFTGIIRREANSTIESPVQFRFMGSNGIYNDLSSSDVSTLINDGQILQIQSIGTISNLGLNAGETQFSPAITNINSLDMQQGVVINLLDNNTINILDNIIHRTGTGNPSIIRSGSKGAINHDLYKKYCFENIQVNNVDLTGSAVINLGATAVITNSSNWQSLNCADVLFTNFDSEYNCVGALVEFTNTTEGPASSYRWTFGSIGTSQKVNPTFIFPQAGIYKITLEAVGDGKTMKVEKEVEIGENVLSVPSIVINGSQLTSLVPASGYQWYKDGIKIEGANERSYLGDGEGVYQVAVLNESCNRISNPVVISSLEEETPLSNYGYFIGPNPATDQLTVSITNDYKGMVELEFYSPNGALLRTIETQKNQQQFSRDIRLDFQPGIYLLLIKTSDMVLTQRIIIH